MKKLSILILLLGAVLLSCHKTNVSEMQSGKQREVSWCSATALSTNEVARIYPHANERISTATPVLFLDYDGQNFQSIHWNGGNPVSCTATAMNAAQKDSCTNTVKEEYAAFGVNITITTDSTLYLAAPATTRQRCIIMHSSTPTITQGGSALISSFYWGLDLNGHETPCVVQDSYYLGLLFPSPRWIGLASAHELGHTLGLYHQSKRNPDCTILSNYRQPTGTDADNYVPLMGGMSGNVALNTFTTGETDSAAVNCSSIKNEWSIITSRAFSLSTDLNHNTVGTAYFASLGLTYTDLLEDPADGDFFAFPQKTSPIVTLTSFGCVDLVAELYNGSGVLIATADIDNNISIPAYTFTGLTGRYIKVRNTTTNTNIPPNSLRGKYTIKIQ